MDEIVIPSSIPEMVTAYDHAVTQIELAYDILLSAEKSLEDAFGAKYANFSTMSRNAYRHDDAKKEVLNRIKKSAWQRFVERTELRKVLSVKQAEKLDEQLERGEILPDVTVENVVDTLKLFLDNTTEFAKDAIVEVFDLLRPPNSRYKTNPKYEIKKRVIKHWVEAAYGPCPFRVSYYHEKDVIAVDRVFHLLDGGGVLDGYKSPLVDAINTAENGIGATKYFKFKCHQNGNLHLEFLRPDLVARLNTIGGEGLLRGEA